MRPRSRILVDLVLLTLVVVLVLLVYFQPGIEKPKPLPVLTSVDPGSLGRIEVDYPGQAPIVLVKEQDEWWLSQPLHVPANRFRADTLAQLARAGSLQEYPAAELDLAKFKLDKPLMKVRFDATELAFGDTDPLNGRRYVLTNGKVHLITDEVADLTGGAVTTYVSHSLLPENARPVWLDLPLLGEGGEAQKPFQGQVELRFEDHRWTLKPPREKLSQDSLNRLVDGWRFAAALEVKEAPKGERPIARVSIKLDGAQSPMVFDVTAVKPEAHLVRPDLGLEYVIAENTTERLFRLKPAEPPGK
jgi:hypothetical protein